MVEGGKDEDEESLAERRRRREEEDEAEHAEIKTDDGDMIGIETEIDLLCLAQAAHEQGREDQGDRGEHRLRNQQGQTEISTAHTLHGRFAALERVDHIRA